MSGDSKSTTATTGCAGIRAARLAASGATGAPDVLGAEKGFYDRFSYLPFPELLSGFGASWVTQSLSYKPYPGCAYVQTPVELVEGMDMDVRADEVESVVVEAPLLTCGMEEMSRPHRSADRLPPSNVTFSVPYTVAAAVVSDGYGVDALSRSWIRENREALDDVAEKVELRHGWRYTVEALEGMTDAVALDDLLAERSVREKVAGLRDFREEHSRVSATNEVARLLRSGRLRDFLGSFSSPVGGDGFDLADARFDEFAFRFGASVEVDAVGTQTAEATSHTGAAGHGDGARDVVHQKLRDATPEDTDADAVIDIVDGIEDRELSALTEALR